MRSRRGMGKRVTADDYDRFLVALCGLPPGETRDHCVREMVSVFLRLYANYGVSPPLGRGEYAERLRSRS